MRTHDWQACAAIICCVAGLGTSFPAASQSDGLAPTPEEILARASQKVIANGLYMTGFSAAFGNNYSDVRLTVPAINNDSPTRTRGILRLEYWAAITPPAARGESFASGYRLARFANLSQLEPRTSHTNLVQASATTPPPDGTYWLVLLLEEHDPANCPAEDGFCVQDSLTGSQRTFGAQAASHQLTVTLSGTGSGTVTSSPSGISCGAMCTAIYASPSAVTLTATPSPGSTFAGWGGACSGTGSCTVPMTQPRSVTATFDS